MGSGVVVNPGTVQGLARGLAAGLSSDLITVFEFSGYYMLDRWLNMCIIVHICTE